MDTTDSRSDSSDYSCDKRRGKSDTSTYYTSSQCDTSGKSSCSSRSKTDCSDYTNYSSCDSKKRRSSDCSSYDCGIKYSESPVGVWNFVYGCDTACTTTGTMEWINQVMMNGDGTVTVYSAPDVGTNPYPCMLTPGLGVWKEHGDRKIKVELTNIAYRCGDGATQAYYRTHIVLKLNRKGTRLRFCGESCPYDISDPKMCTPVDAPSLCFSGHGTKVLQPGC